MPNDLPPYRIEVCDASRREPGLKMFNVRPGGGDLPNAQFGWFIAVDESGEIAFNLKLESPTQDARVHPNGNIVYSQTGIGLVTECDRQGNTLRQWHATGKWTDKTPPQGSIPIDIPLIHHTLNVFPNGNLLLNSAEGREIDDWYGSDSDPDAPREKSLVIGDVFYEVSLDGKILREWHAFDFLDIERICYGSLSGYWSRQGFVDSKDWCHANSSCYSAADDCLLISFRTQDCLLKLDCASGEIKWILGTHDNWRAPWSDKLLTPADGLEWQFHQHDISVTPSGTIMCFDNGNFRTTPFDTKLPASDNASRIVEFEVDEENMTVRQVWAYGDGPGERLYACFQGGAYRLPQTGNSFMTYGGICTNDGVASDDNAGAFCRSRLVEITPDKEIVFDMWIDASDEADIIPLSSFRTEHIPPA